MTAAFLQSELTNLISDSRRKHTDVKAAAEKSLADLKSISVTSETQLAGDLIRKTSFIDPFLLACKSQNVKLASNGAACLQRLVASTAIPRSRLPDLLQAFEEAVALALEVQLKILQTLPSLLQLYAADLHGEALSRTLSVCADLSGNKLPMVSSTASATFQQLLSAVFTKATTKPIDRSQNSPQSDSARDSEDALAIFIDLCALLSGGELDFVRLDKLPPSLILETVESLLSTYGAFVFDDPDVLKACAESLVPGLATLIESSASFPVVVRATRITFILASQHLSRMKDAMADLLMIVLKIADRGGSHKWKRVLGLEFCRGFCSDFEALRRSFAAYDLTDGSINFVSTLMASLVRIASEDPSLIGLGRQSTIPTSAGAESNGDIAGVIDNPTAAGSVAQAEPSSTGLSAQGSTIQTPCLDQYDKISPPEVPETYIFTLVLGAISAFSDGLSKFIMPLSVPSRKPTLPISEEQDDVDDVQLQRKGSLRNSANSNKYQQLINPLTRKDLSRFSNVGECAKLVESCWPAILATCSTFLNAALDSYFYHMLIRTVQKLTQVSGVLELNTPRDALLTTLAKVSVPANVSALMNTFYGGHTAYQSETDRPNGEESSTLSPIASTPRQSVDLSFQSLNVRNLLCLRALLNLGIALGPTLSTSAWTILWQPLEQVEALTLMNPIMKAAQTGAPTSGNEGSTSTTLASELSAVDTARRRMIESTSAYSDSAFQVVCKSLFEMIQNVIPTQFPPEDDTSSANEALRANALSHKSTRSVSGGWAKSSTLEIEVQFVLKFIGRLTSANLHRFRQESSSAISWDLVVATLSRLQSNQRLHSHLRLQCANIIDAIAVESCSASGEEETNDRGDDAAGDRVRLAVEERSLLALRRQIEDVQYHDSHLQKSSDVGVQTILLMLQALHNIVGSRGETLQSGWENVFTILKSVTSHHVLRLATPDNDVSAPQTEVMAKIYSAAFKVTHLVSSDFLASLDKESLAELLTLFAIFGGQRTDLNMSLTTIALYWNVSSLVSDGVNLRPFTYPVGLGEPDGITDKNGRDSSLWHATVRGLQHHCKDSRSDCRNAAARMLAKIIETYMPQMSSRTLNSYYTFVSLPLLNYCSKSSSVADTSWNDTALKVLRDCVDAIQSNAPLFLDDSSFRDTWLCLVKSTGDLLEVCDVGIFATVFQALADVVHSLCQTTTSSVFVAEKHLLEASWNLWLTHDPTRLKLDGHTQDAFASYARFLLAMETWSFESLSTFDHVSQRIQAAVDRIIYNVIHEAYTVDVSKVSVEQEQVLQVLDTLKRLSAGDQGHHILHLLSLARNSIQRSVNVTRGDQPARSARGVRQPTGIAFSTACIKKVRFSLQSYTSSDSSPDGCPFHAVLEACSELIKTKYGALPTNNQNLLWREATLLGTECLALFESKIKHSRRGEVETVSSAINNLLLAILEVPHLESKASEARPLFETIIADEQFDVVQLHAVHNAAQKIFLSTPEPLPQSSLKQYILSLFNHSLVARPWYNDLSPDLKDDPLKSFNKIRPGSIRAPNLTIRQNIYPEALQCLFSLVARPNSSSATDSKTSDSETSTLSTLAAPYILLRFAHTLKTFLADQPLRYLQHPHRTLQQELRVVFRAFLDLRVSDNSFETLIAKLSLDVNTLRQDGKTHLRVMTGLVTRFEKLWRGLPRLKKGLAWQDHEDGRAIEQCLVEWREVLNKGATLRFD